MMNILALMAITGAEHCINMVTGKVKEHIVLAFGRQIMNMVKHQKCGHTDILLTESDQFLNMNNTIPSFSIFCTFPASHPDEKVDYVFHGIN